MEQQTYVTVNDFREYENYMNLINHRLDSLEQKQRKMVFLEGFAFSEGDVSNALRTFRLLANCANKSIILFDSKIDSSALEFFEEKNKDVSLTIITSSASALSQSEIDKYIKNHGKLEVLVNEKCEGEHYLIYDDEFFYFASGHLCDIGKNFFMMSQIHDDWYKKSIKKNVHGI